MAQQLLVSILVYNTPGGDFVNNDVVNVYWNDSSNQIELTKNGSPFVASGASQIGRLNTNYYVSGITSYEGEYAISGYSFCSGNDLKWFRMVTDFPMPPFMQIQTTANSTVCAMGGGPVCDLKFEGPIQVTHSADKTTGGSVKFELSSSNGPIKYSLRDFNYATEGTVASGVNTISSLVPGDWLIYVKDAAGCSIVKGFRMLFKPVDQEHYRFTWASKKIGKGESRDARVRIYEREYVGDVVEIDFGMVSPFKLNKPKQGYLNEKFYPLHPTYATIHLFSIEDYQFLPLFNQDNKKYRVVYEVDEGSGFTPLWSGFIEPNVYREDFTNKPYPVEIPISDNLKILESTPFTDDDGNLMLGNVKLIKVIAFILRKTGLSLNIRSGINIFEANHNTDPEDDPLDQTFIDVACYRDKEGAPFNCWDVLHHILKPFGATLKQYDNCWIIEEEDRMTDEYAYRLFDADGDYLDNGTYDPVKDVKAPTLTDRIAFIERDHSLEVIPAYGKIKLNTRLNYIGSVVAGGFEKTDLLSPESETFNTSQGIYTSEDGFRDWTLRLNGTTGVSFGRIEVSNRGDSSRIGLQNPSDNVSSVGAFFFNPNAWSGNLRNAYIESAVKPYQYGPGDELKLFFEYSTPAKTDFPFMVLRIMLKVGSNYLQSDGTWDTTESIYRAYPPVSNSLQKFELTVPVPETDEVVDSTVQVRIYYYASLFYDHGIPTATNDIDDGTDGVASLKGVVTAGVEHNYQSDIRREISIGPFDAVYREFYELRVATNNEDVDAGIIRPDDYNGTSNPKIWYRTKSVNSRSDELNKNRRGLDVKFYIDNVALDALINGQPPPTELSEDLNISKYITETLEVELYNFDVPLNITNAKNMYNNYFKLADGSPTQKWARSGIPEALPLHKILLKVLGGNHSAPTFRVTGSFLNEFGRIGINDSIRITKPGSDLVMTNTDFDSNDNGWSQSTLPLFGGWIWASDNGGCVETTLTDENDSKKIYQQVTHRGGYIEIDININAVPEAGNTREDALFLLFYKGNSIIHTEKLKTFEGVTSESLSEFKYITYCQAEVTRIGFFMKAVAGSGTCKYQVGKFDPVGKDLQEVYRISDYQSEERLNTYYFELMQLSKTYVSLSNIDQGGNNQSGSTSGREHSSAYSSAYS